MGGGSGTSSNNFFFILYFRLLSDSFTDLYLEEGPLSTYSMAYAPLFICVLFVFLTVGFKKLMDRVDHSVLLFFGNFIKEWQADKPFAH